MMGAVQITGLAHKAALMAARAHERSQSRALKGPYIAHPMRVALYVPLWFGSMDDEVLATALLHDVVEKSSARLREVKAEFGGRIAGWVDLLTRPEDMSKEDYYQRLEDAPWQARLVKIADVLDHLDCDRAELPSRVKSAERALPLAESSEPPIRAARAWLETALARARRTLEEAAADR